MTYPKIALAQSILQLFEAKKIAHIVISPGSRNAPLTIGFANHPNFICYSVVDERCAAFFALGLAQHLQEPVAVLCTSGSALLNYYPAVAEAFYSQIPLLILSADRPKSKIDIGDGQTIRQENVFANHILYNANLTENASEQNDFRIQEAIHISKTKKGPVHINIPFEEPLYETVSGLEYQPKVVDFQTNKNDFSLDKKYISQWKNATKKMVLVGELAPNSLDKEIIAQLAKDESVLVFIEKTSNLHHLEFIDTIDAVITPFSTIDFENLQPEILVTFGGMVVSKRIKTFLRKYQPKNHWHIDTLRAYDTYNCLSEHFVTTPNTFFKELNFNYIEQKSNYKSTFLQKREIANVKQENYIKTIPFSDLKVFDFLSKNLPQNIHLQVSNSSAIRYLQLINIDPSITVFCNRGTSGIDGSTSTAIGAALGNEKNTILLTGDISFFYDSNALWNNYIPKSFKIILLNNSGGGIFRILPGHQETEVFHTYFETSHQLNASHLAKMYGFNYFSATDENTLEENWQSFINQADMPSILEIFTPASINDKVLKGFF